MTASVIVGGLSSLHDPLVAAVLARHGVPAVSLACPDDRALATGRQLLARGHCNPTYYLAGAVVNQLRARATAVRQSLAQVSKDSVYVTAGSCGPCRFATYPQEYRRALAAAGCDGAAVAVVEPAALGTEALPEVPGLRWSAAVARDLVRATLLGDVLVRAGCVHRPRVVEPAAVEVQLVATRHLLAEVLAVGGAVMPVVTQLGESLARLPSAAQPGRKPAPVRVRLTGQFFASITDGDGCCRIIPWLERHGAQVEPPAVAEWLLYELWQVGQPRLYPAVPGVAEVPVTALVRRRAHRAERWLRAQHAGYLRAARAGSGELPDMEELAQLAAPHYRPELRGGMAHLEVAHYLQAVRDRSAELVVSIKPFACMPSSGVSDGVNRALAQRQCSVGFVSIETTGDAWGLAESRLELALDRARSASQ